MKDKTHRMNMDLGAEEAEQGFERQPNGVMDTPADRKIRQMKWAGTIDNEALAYQEDMDDANGSDMEVDGKTGFAKRNHFHYR